MAKVAIGTVDDFQGEESDIVLLSLVRSNPEGRIDFIGDRHRVCLAFSHARKGFYRVGDLEGIARGAGGRLWAEILAALKSKGLVGDGLLLTCQKHPEVTVMARDAPHFRQSPEGGCTCRCRTPLPCGHPCPCHCHPRDREHRRVHCCLPCVRPPCERGHPCPKLRIKTMEKVLPRCGDRRCRLSTARSPAGGPWPARGAAGTTAVGTTAARRRRGSCRATSLPAPSRSCPLPARRQAGGTVTPQTPPRTDPHAPRCLRQPPPPALGFSCIPFGGAEVPSRYRHGWHRREGQSVRPHPRQVQPRWGSAVCGSPGCGHRTGDPATPPRPPLAPASLRCFAE